MEKITTHLASVMGLLPRDSRRDRPESQRLEKDEDLGVNEV